MEGAGTQHKEEDDGHAPRLLDAPIKIQDQEGHDREGLDFMWGTDKVRTNKSETFCVCFASCTRSCGARTMWTYKKRNFVCVCLLLSRGLSPHVLMYSERKRFIFTYSSEIKKKKKWARAVEV